jgi:hypothetical protein
VLVFTLAAAAGGCGDKGGQATTPGGPVLARPPERSGAKQIPISNTDPCATRLHDLCGPLLMYYRMHQALPQRLAELKEMPAFGAEVELTCPVSKQPYVYNAFGLPSQDKSERVIIYDATPAHSGFRWAVSIIEPQAANAPLITKVIALPESQFQFNIPVNK